MLEAGFLKIEYHADRRGILGEIFRYGEFAFKPRQLNVIEDKRRGTVRAWHLHLNTWEAFFCMKGKVIFILRDNRKKSKGYNKFKTFLLDEKRERILIVPPGVFHGHIALMDNTRLGALCSRVYNRIEPDIKRIDRDALDFDWHGLLNKH